MVVGHEPSPLMWVVLGPDLSQNMVQRSSKANWLGAGISVDSSLQDFVTLPAEVNVKLLNNVDATVGVEGLDW